MDVVKRLASAALALVVLAILATPAWAGNIRAGVQSDPEESPPNINDGSHAPGDIEQVRVTYDDAGATTDTIRYYTPIPTVSGSRVEATVSSPGSGGPADCLYGSTVVTFNSDFSTGVSQGSMSVSGYAGTVSVPVSISPDKREITFTASHPSLTGLNLSCFNASNYVPDPYGHCGGAYCDYISYRYTQDALDTLGVLVDPNARPPQQPDAQSPAQKPRPKPVRLICNRWDRAGGNISYFAASPKRCAIWRASWAHYQSLTFIKGRWRNWGKSTAYATVTVTYNMGYRHRFRIKAYRLRADCSGTYRIYTRVRLGRSTWKPDTCAD